MDENHTEKVAEMIYGIDVTKDQRKYVKQKFNPILNGTDSLYIRDKEQSRYFVEGLCNLINDNNLNYQTINHIRKQLKECPTQKDWDWVSQQYQDVLVEIKNVKDECKKEVSNIKDEYYMKLKGDLCETKPHQDLINEYNELLNKNTQLQRDLLYTENRYNTIKKTYEDMIEEYVELKDNPDKKLRKKIEKEMSKKEDETKKELQRQVNNLKKLLKMEQDKNMLLINTQ